MAYSQAKNWLTFATYGCTYLVILYTCSYIHHFIPAITTIRVRTQIELDHNISLKIIFLVQVELS